MVSSQIYYFIITLSSKLSSFIYLINNGVSYNVPFGENRISENSLILIFSFEFILENSGTPLLIKGDFGLTYYLTLFINFSLNEQIFEYLN